MSPPAPADAAAARYSTVFKAYDIRGRVPGEIDAPMVWGIGGAFAGYVAERGASGVVIGRDMRSSGPELSAAFAAGVLDAGLEVLDAGLVSTDMLYFASGRLDLPGAVLTASHNPAAYNGIKCCLAGARPIGEETGLNEIREAAERLYGADPAKAATRAARPVEGDAGYQTTDLLEAFSEHVRSFLTVEVCPLRVVADT
ncbi:MAG: phosphomannomutase/phosphoglucomutase, partial [Acidimicrobiales bacterium]